jgi:hypothetical protein
LGRIRLGYEGEGREKVGGVRVLEREKVGVGGGGGGSVSGRRCVITPPAILVQNMQLAALQVTPQAPTHRVPS